jgi:hypothetical protein
VIDCSRLLTENPRRIKHIHEGGEKSGSNFSGASNTSM